MTIVAGSATRTKALLACGIVAGPLFLATTLLQAIARRGYDLSRHPISLLSLGDLGWIQIANFTVAGALYVGCAIGIRRALQSGPAATWGPLLVGAFGVGLIMGGVFLSDAGAGYPPGAPEGAPEHMSWHAILHGVGALLGFGGLTAAAVVFARRFAKSRQWGWFAACVTTAVLVVIITAWPNLDTLSIRLLLGAAIQFAFVAALAVHLMHRPTG